MKENEKIAYAMEHYTEGCVYTHPDYNYRKEYTFKYKPNSYEVFSNSTGNVDAGQGNGYLYFNNQWATIIKKGIEPDWVAIAKIKYPEGTTYICPFSLKTHKLIVKDDTYELMGGSSINAGWDLGYLRYNEAWATIVEDEKVDKFEVGKWYKRDTGTYIKFLKLEDNVFVASENIPCSDLKYYKVGGKFGDITDSSNTYTLLTDLTEIQKYLPDGHVDKINKEINMFKKGDYIVTLKVQDNSTHFNCGRNNYCFKQKVDNEGIYPEVDLQGNSQNGHNMMSFDKKSWLKNWRYATFQEIVEYDRLGKPFDVTTLDRIDELTNPTYVKCIESYSGSYEIGKIYKVDEKGNAISYGKPTAQWNNTNDYQSKFKPSTTDDWNAQEINKSNIDEFTKNTYDTNLIKVLYTKSKQKTISKEKIKKVKFLNVNIIKIN